MGIAIALTLILSWIGWLSWNLTQPLHETGWFFATFAIMVQMFLHTGLFITAHDAMHGSVTSKQRLNRAIGQLCLLLYALFDFKRLHASHRMHHREPASEHDPDFHAEGESGFWRWYLHFLFGYITWKQIVGMALIFNLLAHGLGVAEPNLILFWVLPSLLSTLQLFYFGTYLPHRRTDETYSDRHRARSSAFPLIVSFLTCYHFGYHLEHHRFPGVPWWRLPRVRRQAVTSENG